MESSEKVVDLAAVKAGIAQAHTSAMLLVAVQLIAAFVAVIGMLFARDVLRLVLVVTSFAAIVFAAWTFFTIVKLFDGIGELGRFADHLQLTEQRCRKFVSTFRPPDSVVVEHLTTIANRVGEATLALAGLYRYGVNGPDSKLSNLTPMTLTEVAHEFSQRQGEAENLLHERKEQFRVACEVVHEQRYDVRPSWENYVDAAPEAATRVHKS